MCAMVWVTSFSVQTCFTHSFLLITQTKSRTETALTLKAPNLNLPHKLFPELQAEEFKETDTCILFFFPVILSRRHSKSRAPSNRTTREWVRLSVSSDNFPATRASTCMAVAALGPLLTDSAATFPTHHTFWSKQGCGVMKCLCIPLFSPHRPHP